MCVGTYISELLLFVWKQIAVTLHVSGAEESLIPPKLSYYLGEIPKLCLFSRAFIPRRATENLGRTPCFGSRNILSSPKTPYFFGEKPLKLPRCLGS